MNHEDTLTESQRKTFDEIVSLDEICQNCRSDEIQKTDIGLKENADWMKMKMVCMRCGTEWQSARYVGYEKKSIDSGTYEEAKDVIKAFKDEIDKIKDKQEKEKRIKELI